MLNDIKFFFALTISMIAAFVASYYAFWGTEKRVFLSTLEGPAVYDKNSGVVTYTKSGCRFRVIDGGQLSVINCKIIPE